VILREHAPKRTKSVSRLEGLVVEFLECPGDDIDDDVLADRLRQDAEGMGRECLAEQVVPSCCSAVIRITGSTPWIWRTREIVSSPESLGEGRSIKARWTSSTLDDVERLFAALGEKRTIADRLEDLAKSLPRRRIVIGDEDGGTFQGNDDLP